MWHLTSWQFPRLFRKYFRIPIPAVLILALVAIYYHRICIQDGTCSARPSWTQKPQIPEEEIHSLAGYVPTTNITVNLVMATVVGDDISWTKKINMPNANIKIIRYFADDPKAPFHSPRNKGREATMYHTYFHDFYDKLPDVSVMIHAHENPWHAEAVLDDKMSYILSHLDLFEVQQRGYANLRVGWDDGCPDWIDTSKSAEDSRKKEEPHMHHSILEIFSGVERSESSTPIQVPHILGTPCCSQFAITREKIRAIPREDYNRFRQWLLDTDLSDYISGRVWEHIWQWVFTGREIDCPIEWKTYCRLYHICFATPAELRTFFELGWEAGGLRDSLSLWAEISNPQAAEFARVRIKEIQRIKAGLKREALRRGQDPQWRLQVMGDIYDD